MFGVDGSNEFKALSAGLYSNEPSFHEQDTMPFSYHAPSFNGSHRIIYTARPAVTSTPSTIPHSGRAPTFTSDWALNYEGSAYVQTPGDARQSFRNTSAEGTCYPPLRVQDQLEMPRPVPKQEIHAFPSDAHDQKHFLLSVPSLIYGSPSQGFLTVATTYGPSQTKAGELSQTSCPRLH
jgi:hypothetical protein